MKKTIQSLILGVTILGAVATYAGTVPITVTFDRSSFSSANADVYDHTSGSYIGTVVSGGQNFSFNNSGDTLEVNIGGTTLCTRANMGYFYNQNNEQPLEIDCDLTCMGGYEGFGPCEKDSQYNLYKTSCDMKGFSNYGGSSVIQSLNC